MMEIIKFLTGKRIVLLLTILSSIISLANTQLNTSEISVIQKKLTENQDESTGLFNKSFSETLKSIKILKTLGNSQIKNLSKICRDLSYETENDVKLELLELNTLLDCKLSFTNLEAVKQENFEKMNFSALYNALLISIETKVEIDWEKVFTLLIDFTDEYLFFRNNREDKEEAANLILTTNALKILIHISNLPKNTPEFKGKVLGRIDATWDNLIKEFQVLKKDVGYFFDNNISTLDLNSELSDILPDLRTIVKIEYYELLTLRMLNYFLTFKDHERTIDNLLSYFNILKNFQNLPLLTLEKSTFNYVEEKTLNFKLLNSLGNEMKDFNVTLAYSIDEEQKKADKPKTDSLDLEDEEEEKAETSSSMSFTNVAQLNIEMNKILTKPQIYKLNVGAKISNKLNTFNFGYNFNINSFSKVKINHLKMSVSNTNEKNDQKENTIEYPKRSFKNIKATQKSVIRLKVNMKFGDSQKGKVEQLFLRLRHIEYGKSYSAYVRDYKEQEDFYFIAFDMSDPHVMDAYDGTYELTLLLSDVTMENPIIWNFGKIEVTFRKPLDPTNLSYNHKNIQKPKMEPFFEVEQSTNKNYFGALIFSGILSLLTFYFLIYLKQIKANIGVFGKGGNTNLIFSGLFVMFLFLVAYVLVCFFWFLNLVQTLFIFGFVGLPGVIITYKALSSITIEV